MDISNDTLEVIKFLNQITGDNLRKPGDLAILLETGANNGIDELVNRIIFNGTSIWNMSQRIKRAEVTKDINFIKTELNKSTSLFREDISEFLNYADDETKARYKKTYIVDTQGALKNIIDFCHDLFELKNVQNTLKSKGKS